MGALCSKEMQTNNRGHQEVYFKFGFEILDTVKCAKELDHLNGNTLWMDALAKEMTNVCVAFKILEVQYYLGYQT